MTAQLSCFVGKASAAGNITCKILIPSVGLMVAGEALKSNCTKLPGFGRAMTALNRPGRRSTAFSSIDQASFDKMLLTEQQR